MAATQPELKPEPTLEDYQLAVAKLIPEDIEIMDNRPCPYRFYWRKPERKEVCGRELLCMVELAELTLSDEQYTVYAQSIIAETEAIEGISEVQRGRRVVSAGWLTRAKHLFKTTGGKP